MTFDQAQFSDCPPPSMNHPLEDTKRLPPEFRSGDFTFRQLKREGAIVLFEKSKPSHSRKTFEIVVIQEHPERILFGKSYSPKEALPRSESWGQLGWTFTDLSGAESRFALLSEHRKKRPDLHRRTPASMFSGVIAVNTAEVDR